MSTNDHIFDEFALFSYNKMIVAGLCIVRAPPGTFRDLYTQRMELMDISNVSERFPKLSLEEILKSEDALNHLFSWMIASHFDEKHDVDH